MAKYRIAVIPGDGIGNEVVPAGIEVLEKVGAKFGVDFQWDEFDWSCERFHNVGSMMPEDGLDQIRDHDAIYLGAVGFPGVPDHVSLWGLLIPIRRKFNQYVNLRPVRLFEGVASPLAGRFGRLVGRGAGAKVRGKNSFLHGCHSQECLCLAGSQHRTSGFEPPTP